MNRRHSFLSLLLLYVLRQYQALTYHYKSHNSICYEQSKDQEHVLSNSRRSLVTKTISTSMILSSGVFFGVPRVAVAASNNGDPFEGDVIVLEEASEALESLLNNWERATELCTFADVPRELLETRNKEQLLDKASTFALFDKSVSVTSCKTSNKIVRDYIGATGKGPLVGIEKRLRKRQLIEHVDPDFLDEFIAESELFSQSLAKATSLSYAAGVADFDSMNNFQQGRKSDTGTSNLEETKKSIFEAKISLDKLLRIILSS